MRTPSVLSSSPPVRATLPVLPTFRLCFVLFLSSFVSFWKLKAYDLNNEVFKTLKESSCKASEYLAKKFGEPDVLKGYGRRNTTLNAIAPTTSSAFILGQVSQGIEPIWSNIYVKDIAKIKTTIKNPFLIKLLKEGQKVSRWELYPVRFICLDLAKDDEGLKHEINLLIDETKASL